MHETTADVRRDIEETRARVSRTLAELQDEVGGRRAAITERVVAVKDGVTSTAARAQDGVVEFAREHPWYALAAAVGIGVLIGRSGADEAAARRAVEGARTAATSAAGAATGAARTGVEKAKGLLHRGGDESSTSGAGVHPVAQDPRTDPVGSAAEDGGALDVADESGIVYRLRRGVVEALGVNELLGLMREEADRIGPPRSV